MQESEFNIKGYNLFNANVGKDKQRGIITYVSDKLNITKLEFSSSFRENLVLQIRVTNDTSIIFGTFYRSPISDSQNDFYLLDLINSICKEYKDRLILIGDFNLPNISWLD